MCGAPCAATAAAPRPPLFSIHPSDGASLAMHSRNQFELLRQRRFAPFFYTQFLGAANDNVFKNAFIKAFEGKLSNDKVDLPAVDKEKH